MANRDHLRVLSQGVEKWNRWRVANQRVKPDLSGADLTERDLKRANLSGCNLQRSILRKAKLSKAQLSGADLSKARLEGARLRGAYLRGAKLRGANLSGCNLRYTNLSQADVHRANLGGAAVYGISVWNLRGQPINQAGLLVNRRNEAAVPVDDLELAHFLHLLGNHHKLRQIISASTGRLVLLLGGFSAGGLEHLRALAEALRRKGYFPVVFDFKRPKDKSTTDTVGILAGLARFVVADLAGPSVPLELGTRIPHHMIPFVLLQPRKKKVFSMARDLPLRSSLVLPLIGYSETSELVRHVRAKIIGPAERARLEYAKRLAAAYGRRASRPSTRRAKS